MEREEASLPTAEARLRGTGTVGTQKRADTTEKADVPLLSAPRTFSKALRSAVYAGARRRAPRFPLQMGGGEKRGARSIMEASPVGDYCAIDVRLPAESSRPQARSGVRRPGWFRRLRKVRPRNLRGY